MESGPRQRFKGWIVAFRPASMNYGWVAVTLVVGVAGACLFLLARLPLPWMLGPMVLAMFAGLAGVPLRMPQAVRSPMLVVLGVMVGATAAPELLSRAPEWIGPLVGMVF